MDYKEYITSPQWKARSRMLRNKVGHCQLCGCEDKFKLQCHHRTYRNLGNEKDEDLVVICKDCHELIEEIKNWDGFDALELMPKIIGKLVDYDTYKPNYFPWLLGEYKMLYNNLFKSYVEQTFSYEYYDKEWLSDLYSVKYETKHTDDLMAEFAKEIPNYAEEDILIKVRGYNLPMPINQYTIACRPIYFACIANRIWNGVNGIDDRVTYYKDSGDDLKTHLSGWFDSSFPPFEEISQYPWANPEALHLKKMFSDIVAIAAKINTDIVDDCIIYNCKVLALIIYHCSSEFLQATHKT